jgi:hypothetical protein
MFKANPGKYFVRPHLQNNQSKIKWRCGSSSRAALSSNPSSTKKKEEEEERVRKQDMCEILNRGQHLLTGFAHKSCHHFFPSSLLGFVNKTFLTQTIDTFLIHSKSLDLGSQSSGSTPNFPAFPLLLQNGCVGPGITSSLHCIHRKDVGIQGNNNELSSSVSPSAKSQEAKSFTEAPQQMFCRVSCATAESHGHLNIRRPDKQSSMFILHKEISCWTFIL